MKVDLRHVLAVSYHAFRVNGNKHISGAPHYRTDGGLRPNKCYLHKTFKPTPYWESYELDFELTESDWEHVDGMINYVRSLLFKALTKGGLSNLEKSAVTLIDQETLDKTQYTQNIGVISFLPQMHENDKTRRQIVRSEKLLMAPGSKVDGAFQCIGSTHYASFDRYKVSGLLDRQYGVTFWTSDRLEAGAQVHIKGRVRKDGEGDETILHYVRIAK